MLRLLNRTEEAVICLLLALTTLLVFVDVVMRFGFNTGFMWTQELTLHMSAWFVLFGASYGIKVGSHIGVDAFIKMFPRTSRRILSAIGCLFGLAYCAMILYGSWIYLDKVKRIGIELEDIPIPAWIAHSILIIGFLFLSIRIFILLWDIITNKADGFRYANEADDSMELVEELKEEGVKL